MNQYQTTKMNYKGKQFANTGPTHYFRHFEERNGKQSINDVHRNEEKY